MTQPNESREAEAIPVTLAHILGNVNTLRVELGNGLEKLVDLKTELIQHRGQIGVIQSDVQQLQSDAKAAAKAVTDADKAREDTATALEKQNTLAVSKAKDAVDTATRQSEEAARQSASIWAPYAKLFVILGVVLAALSAYAAFKYGSATSP
jgi:chromosome segregation ATPase